jgi:hypothetical protein
MSNGVNLNIGEDGKVVLSDAKLQELETFFVRAGGDGETNSTCSGSNSSCTNDTDCRKTSNSGTCMNSGTCRSVNQQL